MLFKHSERIAVPEYDARDLHGVTPIRRNRNGLKEHKGSLRCQHDWSKYVRPLHNYNGGLAGEYSVMQVCIPECLPERLEMISYANEFAFLYDDATENLDQEELDSQNDAALAAFREGLNGSGTRAGSSGIRIIQAQMLKEMKAIDEPRAVEAMIAWNQFLKEAGGRQHHKDFKSLDEYIEYRLMDVGEMFWYGMVTFGMGITIPKGELERCHQLAKTAYIVLGLQNDIYSWAKEASAAAIAGSSKVVNAIYVLMDKHGQPSVDAAIKECRRLIRHETRQYEACVANQLLAQSLSPDTLRYLEALLYSISGNALWSCVCPRYQ